MIEGVHSSACLVRTPVILTSMKERSICSSTSLKAAGIQKQVYSCYIDELFLLHFNGNITDDVMMWINGGAAYLFVTCFFSQ
jgi:hypothetical protein